MYKLCFYVPDSHLEAVKKAVFAIGAGRIGAYDSCCWQVLGQGQYRPLEGSQPFLGQTGQVQHVPEWKVEMVVADELIHDSVKAMKRPTPTKRRPSTSGVYRTCSSDSMLAWPAGASRLRGVSRSGFRPSPIPRFPACRCW